MYTKSHVRLSLPCTAAVLFSCLVTELPFLFCSCPFFSFVHRSQEMMSVEHQEPKRSELKVQDQVDGDHNFLTELMESVLQDLSELTIRPPSVIPHINHSMVSSMTENHWVFA